MRADQLAEVCATGGLKVGGQIHAAHFSATLNATQALRVSKALATRYQIRLVTTDEIRAANLLALIDEAGGPAAFSRKVGMAPSQVAQLAHRSPDSKTGKPRGMRPATARRFEAAGKRPTGWLDVMHPESGVAQSLSHLARTVNPQKLTWEQIVSGVEPEELFTFPLPDDANAPDYPAGLVLMWSTTKEPKARSLVLIRDDHGIPHVRRYHQGKEPGTWSAVPSEPAFPTFASTEATIIAVAAWNPMP